MYAISTMRNRFTAGTDTAMTTSGTPVPCILIPRGLPAFEVTSSKVLYNAM